MSVALTRSARRVIFTWNFDGSYTFCSRAYQQISAVHGPTCHLMPPSFSLRLIRTCWHVLD